MEENKKDSKPEKEINFQSGEKGFAVILLLIGLFFTWQSFILYQQSPGASSYGAVPLFCSSAITLLSLVIIITDRKKRTNNTGLSLAQQIQNVRKYLFGKDVIVICILMILYCLVLYMNAGFMIATPIFLWVSMTYLGRGNVLKNLFWTVVCMVFIYVVFQVLFSVVLP